MGTSSCSARIHGRAEWPLQKQSNLRNDKSPFEGSGEWPTYSSSVKKSQVVSVAYGNKNITAHLWMWCCPLDHPTGFYCWYPFYSPQNREMTWSEVAYLGNNYNILLWQCRDQPTCNAFNHPTFDLPIWFNHYTSLSSQKQDVMQRHLHCYKKKNSFLGLWSWLVWGKTVLFKVKFIH